MLEVIKPLTSKLVLESEPLSTAAIETVETPILNLVEKSQSAPTAAEQDTQMPRPHCGINEASFVKKHN